MINCPVCSKVFETNAGLKFHQKSQMCHFKCSICVVTFATKIAVNDHEKKKHNVDRRKSGDSKEDKPIFKHSETQEKPQSQHKVKPTEQTSELSDDWKEDPTLPSGWKCITRMINGKSREFLLDPNSGIFPSIDSAVRHMTKNPIYLPEDIERIKNRGKAPAKVPEIDFSLPSFNEKPAKVKTENAKQKMDFKSQDWIEEDPTVPPGWKIRRTKSELIEAPGNHFLRTRIAVERRQIFLSPSGKMFLGRKAVLDHMLEDGGYSAQDIDTLEKGIEKRIVKWVRDSPTVPPGWKTRLLKGREMFQSPSGAMFLGRISVLDHLVAGGASSEEIFTVERGSIGWERLWVEEKELPSGWKVRPISGLCQSEVNSFYMSPAGRIFVGIDAAQKHASKGIEEEEVVPMNEHSKDILKPLGNKIANMEVIYHEDLEQSIDNTNGLNDLLLDTSEESHLFLDLLQDASEENNILLDLDSNDLEGEDQGLICDISPQNSSDQASAILKLISCSTKKRLFLEDEYDADIVSSKRFKCDIDEMSETVSMEDEYNEKSLSEIQLEILKMAYKQWPHPNDEVVQQITLDSGLDEQYVKYWFWNTTWTKLKSARVKAKNSAKKRLNIKLEDDKNVIDLTASKKDRADKKTRAVLVLKSAFKVNSDGPNQERLVWLKRETGLKISAILRWFDNRRTKMTKKSGIKSEMNEKKQYNHEAGIGNSGMNSTGMEWIQIPTI